MDSKERIVFAWGVSVTFGWIGTMILPTPVYALTGIEPVTTVLTWWVLLLGLAAVNSVMEMWTWMGPQRVLLVWIGLISLGLIENIYAASTFVTAGPLNFSFLTLWFILASIGFAYTGYKTAATSRQIYVFAGIFNISFSIAVTLWPGLLRIAFLAGLVLQGLPVLADWFLVHRQG